MKATRYHIRTTEHFVGALTAIVLTAVLLCGCSTKEKERKNQPFFTSGSRDADQRASQRMAKDEQLAGSGEGSGEKGVVKASVATEGGTGTNGTNQAAQVIGKLALYDRLGGDAGISNIVADFTPRVMQDPRVNWNRDNVKHGGLSVHAGKSETWDPNPQNVAMLEKHLVQFLSLATGGPAHYEGKQIQSTHASMHISNPEFDAAIGDLKASLDRLKIPNQEQKELLAIVESTRPQIVTER
jgi:hemoglobin